MTEQLAAETTRSGSFRVSAIPPETLERIRTREMDDFGNVIQAKTDRTGGTQLRCCLRHSEPGERIALLAYDPFPWSGPYAEVGPVFVHADECGGWHREDAYPDAFRSRQKIFRAYGYDRTIVGAEIAEGWEAEATVARLFTRPDVDFAHCRNVAHGCFVFTITRAS